MISVNENEDGSFTISWDENDPYESIFNEWTEKDFIDYLMARCNEELDGKEGQS
ncbi:hypothetical protein SSZBM1_37 [Synechococcus phage S-SZBM1]|uniref:Uncharacterized protein n=1 Tax=Synechococcus phage S-SZBM1 TaxID=2926475 RepID=A0AC61TSE7_9CAUD|nr:hypothetical protein PP650_gp037 [Synechococcus phage S-SZBM1]UNH61154.1 hypothetical protein SSZBM1_37 [Synechococcus phage S-SZBM1]